MTLNLIFTKPIDKFSKLVRICPECTSGDVEFCNISVRPYCRECNHWSPVNFGTADDAINAWNSKLNKKEI